MDPITQQTLLVSAGGKKDPLYVDDVFSTHLWAGTGNTNLTINNGIDLDGEGGLVWLKQRSSPSEAHTWIDTERGQTKVIMSNYTYGNFTSGATQDLTSFNSNGFSLGPNFNYVKNNLNKENVSWTFRKAPGFFDVVTWSGTNTNRNIAHNLGSVPGMVIVKRTDASDAWYVYHRSHGATKYLELNLTGTGHTSSATWNNTTPTSSVFTVGSFLNATGATYVAYVFAHDDAVFGTDEDQSIIKCGITPTVSQYSTETIDLGFEPQFLLMKAVNQIGTWMIVDTMRGVDSFIYTPPTILNPNSSSNEGTSADAAAISSNGYTQHNGTGGNSKFIYMAIRRPNKPPELATEVFAIDNQASGTKPPQYHSNFVVDMALEVAFNEHPTYRNRNIYSRILLTSYLKANLPNKQVSTNREMFTWMNGFGNNNSSVITSYAWMFKRAPGFFDVAAYTGNDANGRTVPHNLEAVPQLMIIKGRNQPNLTYANWTVYYKSSTAGGANKYLSLNTDAGETTHSTVPWNNTDPTSTEFTLYNSWIVNRGTYSYIAYLFATLPGISKVGTYSGTGNAINVDCGFTNGARFVMIKRSNGTGDWYVWDSVRGIVSGNDPYFIVNGTAGQVTGTDYIDPLSTGFTVTSSAPAALNTSGGTYMFLAIA